MPSKMQMRCGHFGAIVLTALVLCGVSRVSAFAQTNTARWRAVSTLMPAPRAPGDVLRAYLPAGDAADTTVELPRNLYFPDLLRSTLQSMLRRSPTFRRQCLRLANAPFTRVVMRNAQMSQGDKPRAQSRIMLAKDGAVMASVEIRTLQDLPELIAHELEHVIEQLDGIDLRAAAARSATGVRIGSDGAFETTRAVRVGAAVGSETRNGG